MVTPLVEADIILVIHGLEFVRDFMVTPLAGADVILGIQGLEFVRDFMVTLVGADIILGILWFHECVRVCFYVCMQVCRNERFLRYHTLETILVVQYTTPHLF